MTRWLRKFLDLNGEYFATCNILELLVWSVRMRLERAAWPPFDCTNCIGMIEYGCYCQYYGASAPGCGPESRHVVLRRIHHHFWPKSHFHNK